MSILSKISIEKASLFSILVIITIIPLLGVQTPRILAFLPAICLLLSLPLISFKFRKPSKDFLLIYGALLVFIGFLIIHSFFISISTNALERVQKTLPLLFIGTLFLYSVKFYPKINFEKFFNRVLIVCAIASICILLEMYLNNPVFRILRGLQNSPNIANAVYNRGSVIVVLMSLMSYFLIKEKSKKSLLFFVPVLALIYFNMSQSAQLAFVFFAAFYYIFPLSKKIFWYFLFAAITFYFISMPFLMPSLYEAMPNVFNEVGFFQNSYANQRFEIWDFISRKIQENPFWGHGLEFTNGYKGFEPRGVYFRYDSVLHPHNFVMQIWLELGAIGIMFLLSFVAFMMKKIYAMKNLNVQKVALALFATFILLNSFSYGFWQGWWIGLMFTIAGLILLVSHQRDAYKES